MTTAPDARADDADGGGEHDRDDGLGPAGFVLVERAPKPRQLVRAEKPGNFALRILPDAETGAGVAFAQPDPSGRDLDDGIEGGVETGGLHVDASDVHGVLLSP